MIPTPIRPETDPCVLAEQWGLVDELAERLIAMSGDAEDLGLMIISGQRSCREQEALARSGAPATSCAKSTHVQCPATGADLWTTPTPVISVRARFVASGFRVGLRVGGGSPIGTDGIPIDWNHVDLGPVHASR